MRKLIDALAITSFLVSAAIVGSGIYVYSQRDAIVEGVKEKAIAAVTASLPSLIASSLPVGLPVEGLPVDTSLENVDSATGFVSPGVAGVAGIGF